MLYDSLNTKIIAICSYRENMIYKYRDQKHSIKNTMVTSGFQTIKLLVIGKKIAIRLIELNVCCY